MKVLVVNAGSSSLKYQLFDTSAETVLAKGICERIGIGGKIEYRKGEDGEKHVKEVELPDHSVAMKNVVEILTNSEASVISDMSEIEAVGHRVVHGGEKFASSVVIDDDVMAAIEECNPLAPLHNPANLIGIRACQAIMPGVPNIAVFDTAFHQTMEPVAFMYGLPYECYEKYKVRRYGFHGTSHSFVSKRAIEVLGLDPDNSRVIVCHLGNGASISAVKNGKSVDTSMGLTPLEGLVMGTRSGDIDPAIIEYLAHSMGKSLEEIMTLLNKESGVYGLSGVSSDFRDLETAAAEGNERAQMAQDVFGYRVAKYIGAYTAAMNGVDAIVFTAGLGENNNIMREYICSYLGYLGVEIDKKENAIRSEEKVVSSPGSKVKVMVVPTNEELAIARETVALVK